MVAVPVVNCALLAAGEVIGAMGYHCRKCDGVPVALLLKMPILYRASLSKKLVVIVVATTVVVVKSHGTCYPFGHSADPFGSNSLYVGRKLRALRTTVEKASYNPRQKKRTQKTQQVEVVPAIRREVLKVAYKKNCVGSNPYTLIIVSFPKILLAMTKVVITCIRSSNPQGEYRKRRIVII